MAAIMVMVMCCVVSVVSVDAASGYGFRSQGVTVKPGDNATKFINANKKYLQKTTNAKTCIAKSGYDVKRIYTYFTIVTFASKKNGKGKLESIAITHPDVVTPEGLSCGMNAEQIKKCYRDAKSSGNIYTVEKGKTKIYVKAKDGKVKSIEYLYTGKY